MQEEDAQKEKEHTEELKKRIADDSSKEKGDYLSPFSKILADNPRKVELCLVSVC